MNPLQAQFQAKLLQQEMERDTLQAAGAGSAEYGDAGPPVWSRPAWDGFYAQYGVYPYGLQKDGSMVYPPSFENAPDWVFELMHLGRKPPVGFNPYQENSFFD